MPISISGLVLDSDNKSYIDFKSRLRSSLPIQDLPSLSFSERSEAQIMIIMSQKETLKEEKKAKEKKSQQTSKPRELESINRLIGSLTLHSTSG
jgi:hypothetical protein